MKSILLSLRAHKDVKREHLETLNVKVESDIPFSNLIPTTKATTHDPKSAQPDASSRPLLSNGMPTPGPEKYEVLERELRYDNNDAFRELIRLPPLPGKQRIRVTQTRRFWMGLERMSQYWDTSQDQFFEASHDDDGHTEAKRMKMDDSTKSPSTDSMILDDKSAENSTSPTETTSTPRLKYKGRRIGNGRMMPEELRDETIRGFVEMIAWPFGCQAAAPGVPPRLAIDTMLFPIRHSFRIVRPPKDRMQARKGYIEGPILAVQCKGEVSFREEHDRVGDGFAEATDLCREVGAMLLLAQERARQGEKEILPGEGKWWVTKVRWGGGPGGEIEPKEAVTDEPPPSVKDNKDKTPTEDSVNANDPGNDKPDSRAARPSRRGPSSKQRLSLAERWKILRPGSSLWDRKLQHLQIGKTKDDDFDDVSVFSFP